MNLSDTPLNRAVAAHLAGRFAEAEAGYRALLATEDGAARNLSMLLLALGRLDEAEPLLREEAASGDPEAGLDLAICLLAQGRYEEAWPLYEYRRRAGVELYMPPGYTPQMEWRGGDPAGKRFAVIAEQGFGDAILFGRFVDQLRARGASVSYLCRPELRRLLDAPSTLPPQPDHWVAAGSLPGLLGARFDGLPPPARLTVAARPGHGVGVCAEGAGVSDARRGLDPAGRASLLALGRDLSPAATGARDFADTAEIIADLALVITVDTAIAHLAASMGKPTWLLLAVYRVYWPWGRAGTTTPWYPSVRIFRQPEPGDWAPVLAAVRRALDAA